MVKIDTLLSDDGITKIKTYQYYPNKPINGIIQIVHGITEYMQRYQLLASYLNQAGYMVVGMDLTGHGSSLYQGQIKGYIGPDNSWNILTNDVYHFYQKIKQQYANVPYYMLGFSMGSFIVRTLMVQQNDLTINGCFLLGTGYQPPMLLKIIKFFVLNDGKKHGEKQATKLVNKLAFDNYNKKFKDVTTNADWLLQDQSAKIDYLNDSLCLKVISNGLFRELLNGMIITNNAKAKINISFPVYLLSGQNDAVGNFGRGIDKTASLLKQQGVTQVNIKLFKNMRHDILHEKNKQEVFEFLLKSMNSLN